MPTDTPPCQVITAHRDVLEDVRAISMVAGELAVATSGKEEQEDVPDEEDNCFGEEEVEAGLAMAGRMVTIERHTVIHDGQGACVCVCTSACLYECECECACV